MALPLLFEKVRNLFLMIRYDKQKDKEKTMAGGSHHVPAERSGRYQIIDKGNNSNGDSAETLAENDQLHGQARFKNSGVVGELVPHGTDRGGEDIALQ